VRTASELGWDSLGQIWDSARTPIYETDQRVRPEIASVPRLKLRRMRGTCGAPLGEEPPYAASAALRTNQA
jgi:hypothetical protein